MADASVDCHQEPKEDTDKKRKNVLEEKSKDELIALVKKNLNLLHKSKNKIDELNKKCSVLEEEKNTAIEAHQLAIKELENLQHNATELKSEKISSVEDEEIAGIKQALKNALEEKNKYSLLLRENKEQLQCVTMQLQSYKDSCRCMQEENLKLQESNKKKTEELDSLSKLYNEKTEEFNSLSKLYNDLSSDLNKKLTEYSSLLSVQQNTQSNYEKSMDKIYSLETKIQKLETGTDPGIMISRIQEYQEENEKLKKQLKDMSKSKNESAHDSLANVTFEKGDTNFQAALEKTNLSLEQENSTLKSELIDCHDKILELENEIKKFSGSHELGDYKMAIELALLQGAVPESLIYPSELSDSTVKTAQSKVSDFYNKKEAIYEKSPDIVERIGPGKVSDFYSDKKEAICEKSPDIIEGYGLEQALLQGGDTSNLIQASYTEYACNYNEEFFPMSEANNEYQSELEKYEKENKDLKIKLDEYSSLCQDTVEENTILKQEIEKMKAKITKAINHKQTNTDFEKVMAVEEINSPENAQDVKEDFFPMSEANNEYQSELEKYEKENKDLKKKLGEYSSLCQDTVEENTILKQEIEKMKAKITKAINHKQTNTDFEEVMAVEEINSPENAQDVKEDLSSDVTVSCIKCGDLYDEILSFYEDIQPERKDFEHEVLKDHSKILKSIQEKYNEVVSDLEKKRTELNESNLQLELLVIGVKQGVRQKTTTFSYNAENNLKENINTLKVLVDDLVSRVSCSDSKMKIIQSQAASDVQKFEDELNQLKELNQYLEVENRELISEIDKLKFCLNDAEKHGKHIGDSYDSIELYSIDEQCESEEKSDVDSSTKPVLMLNTSDISVQTLFSVQDSAIQVESSFHPELEHGPDTMKDANNQADLIEETSEHVIEQLTKENESLKRTVSEKSSLVESIHCQMDSLMTQVEELTVELKNKDDDLTHSQRLNADLERKLKESQNVKSRLILTLKDSQNIINDFKEKNSDLHANINSFKISNEELINNLKTITFDTIKGAEIQINELTNENESLVRALAEKNHSVKNLQCEIDRLLNQVKELTDELQNQEADLKHSQCLNTDLRKMLKEAHNIKDQQLDALKNAQTLLLEFKQKHSDLSKDVRSFNSTYKELITNVNNDILSIVKQNYENTAEYKKMYNHKENNLNKISDWISALIKDFDAWTNFMEQVTPEFLPNKSQLITTVEEKFLFDEICDKEDCCYIIKNINNLNSNKFKLFSTFLNHLNNYGTLLDEFHKHNEKVSPDSEKTVKQLLEKNDVLEKKLAACTCLNNSEAQEITNTDNQNKVSEASLKNTLEETETKMNKFKQIAIKLKKELTSTKEQLNETVSAKEKLQSENAKLLGELNKITNDHCKYMQNYQSLQNEFDKLQDDCEMYKLNMKTLEEDLGTKVHEVTSLKEQAMNLESQLKSSKHSLESSVSIRKELDNKCADLEGKIIVLESKIVEKEQKITSLEADIMKHLKDYNAIQEENKNLKNQLESAQKEGNKKSLLDLEMADYERSIAELNNKIKKKDDEIIELQNEVASLNERNNSLLEELKSTETLKETEAKRAESLKEILEKTKTELNDLKEHEAELLSKTTSFEVQFESMTQQEEYFKLQLSEASAQIQRLQDSIKTSSENHQRIVRSFEQKISNQKEEILIAHKEVESVKQEFENYKIRVHSVLKQQKSVTPAITTAEVDLKEKLETVNEKLKLQVKDLSEKLTAMSLEYDALQEEHQNLLQRYDKIIEDREQKDKEWRQRLELINAEKNRLCATQEELSSQHMLQNEMLVATYKKQIKIMSEEHKRIVSDLQKQLDAADVEISRLQRDQQKLQGLPVAPSPQESATTFDLLSQERQEGEGSESTDEVPTPIRHLSLATIPTSGFLPFEKLIQSPVEPGTPASYISSYDSEKLTVDLNTANKKIDHLSELLNDSESTNMRLSEQVRLLKDEVRRLENNKEREKHAENLEYLKNVFIKFATLQPGSERAMLVPVLTTMLKLSSNEQQQLKSVAGDAHSDDNMNAGWGSYLHRWSGLS